MAKRKLFDELRLALGNSLAYESDKVVDLRTTEIPAPAKRITPSQIKEIRLALHASQATFAKLINVSANTVESWEQGLRQPRHAALKLLSIAQMHPQVLLEEVLDQSQSAKSRSHAQEQHSHGQDTSVLHFPQFARRGSLDPAPNPLDEPNKENQHAEEDR